MISYRNDRVLRSCNNLLEGTSQQQQQQKNAKKDSNEEGCSSSFLYISTLESEAARGLPQVSSHRV